MSAVDSADLVIIGGGAIGSWASCFAADAGAGKVVVLEQGLAGAAVSSRASGIVRVQGGSVPAIRLGSFSAGFYRRQQKELWGVDSGFRQHGYLILALDEQEVEDARTRIDMQRAEGLNVEWLDEQQVLSANPTLAEGTFVGAAYGRDDGAIDPARNIVAYHLAMRRCGVDLREHTRVTGFEFADAGSTRITGVKTDKGVIATERVLLAGGLQQRALLEMAGIPRLQVGGVRHQVAVTAPHPAFDRDLLPMVLSLKAGTYWRIEDDGLLFGMTRPNETPGEARDIDHEVLANMRDRVASLVSVTAGLGLRRIWAATIDYTPDALPIIGPAIGKEGAIAGLFLASAAGHGMMWGPGVARAAVDLALHGETALLDVTDLGMDRFDEEGRSRLVSEPLALPFPKVAW